MSKKQLSSTLLIVAGFGWLCFLECIFTQSAVAQINLQQLFPEAFEYPHPETYLIDPSFAAIECSAEQRLIGQQLSKKYSDKLDEMVRLQDPGDMKDFKQEMMTEFRAILSDRQNQLFDQVMVAKFFQAEAIRNASAQSAPVPAGVQTLFLLPAVIKLLDIEDWQELNIRDAVELTSLTCQKSNETQQQVLKEIFDRWQRALFGELLDFQQHDFKAASGFAFSFPKSIEEIAMRARYGGPQFLRNHQFVSRFTMSPPDEINMLLKTPFYLDAHMQPNGMFALLLSDEVVKELKFTPDQHDQLKKLKTTWEQENPLPAELSVELSFGSNMTSKTQREASTAANQAYAAIESQVFEVLTASQKERLRQIWNQLVVSMGWSEVSLTFPDWRNFLELSKEQGLAFDRINDEFRSEIQKLVEKLQVDMKETVQGYQETIAKTLNDKQKDQLYKVFGVSLDTDQNGQR